VAVLNSQLAVLVVSQLQMVLTPSQKRQINNQKDLFVKYQTVMQKKDANVNIIFIFTPKTKSGHIKKITLRGKKNFFYKIINRNSLGFYIIICFN